MARNDRSNSGSGRSRNERSGNKRNAGSKRSNRPENEGARSRPTGKNAFSRRQDRPDGPSQSSGFRRSNEGKFGKPKPFGARGKERSDRDGAPPRSEGKRPFSKRSGGEEKRRTQYSGKEGSDETRPPSFNKRGRGDSRGFRRDDAAREERPRERKFQRSDFTKGEPNENFAAKPRVRSERPDDRKRPFSSKKEREAPGEFPTKKAFKKERPERKSFIENKLDKQRKVTRTEDAAAPKEGGLIRLNKFISNSGVCSRREADNLIAMGLVSVNGTTITEMGYKVKPTDDVRYEGKRLKAEKPVYILLNKPKGFITTTEDPQERNTVMNLIANACSERVYPVGRLDRNTTGLLLLTNDGDLADKLTHPSYNVKKIYKVELDKPFTKADFEKMAAGIRLEEGTAVPDDLAMVSDDRMTVGIELHIGWNRIVRRLFESLGYEVVKLDRVVYAGLDKRDLPRGNWRFLTQQEIVRLKHYK